MCVCVCVCFPCSKEHKKHSPNCAFLKIKDPYKMTVENVLDLEKKALEQFIVSQCIHLPVCVWGGGV